MAIAMRSGSPLPSAPRRTPVSYDGPPNTTVYCRCQAGNRELFESFHKNIEKIVRSIELAADYHAQHQFSAGLLHGVLGLLC